MSDTSMNYIPRKFLKRTYQRYFSQGLPRIVEIFLLSIFCHSEGEIQTSTTEDVTADILYSDGRLRKDYRNTKTLGHITLKAGLFFGHWKRYVGKAYKFD